MELRSKRLVVSTENHLCHQLDGEDRFHKDIIEGDIK